jgi:hypothetical protein
MQNMMTKNKNIHKKLILSVVLFFGFVAFSQQKSEIDSAKTRNIEEVSMTKKVFQKKSDRFVYDVAASPVAKGNTAFGLLKETPLVSSTDEKTIQILGKNNAIIYINGKKTNMNPDAIVELLKNTPAENISKIEVITVPGSEYNVESSDGIINIILKKKLDDGMNGNFRMSNTQSYYNSQSAALSLNFRKNKLGISGNISDSDGAKRMHLLLTNGTPINSTISDGFQIAPEKNLGGYLNVDYALTEKQNFAVSWNYWTNRYYNVVVDLFNTVSQNSMISYNKSKIDENSSSYNNSVNLNYEIKTDDLGSKLSVNAAYLNYKQSDQTISTINNSDENAQTLDLAQQFNQETPQLIDNYTVTADFVQKFKNDLTFSVGGNYGKTKTDNDTYFANLDLNSGVFVKDENQSNHFVYDEKISGIYATLEKKFSEKFSGKIGTRFENTNSFGEILNSTINIQRNYNNVLPYANFSYNINDNHNISYTFSSRIRRPSFWEINPVRTYLTPTNYVQNNPFIKAAQVYNQELTYMFKQSYFLVLSYVLTKGNFSQVPLQNDNELRYIRTNFGDKNQISAMFGVQKSLFKNLLTTNTSIGFQNQKLKGFLDTDPITGDKFSPYTLDTGIFSLVVQSNTTIQLDKNKSWFLGINYFYVGGQIENLGVLKPMSNFSVNVKKLWKDWTFKVDFQDIFKTMFVKVDNVQSNGNYNSAEENLYRRSVQLTVSYGFGNKKLKNMRQIDDAGKDVKSRTGGN